MDLRLLTTNELKQEVLEGKGNFIVSFSTTWCGPCKSITPLLEQAQEDNVDNVKIAKFDLESEGGKEFVAKFSIRSVPTIIFFKDGVETERHVGLIQKTALDKRIEKLLKEDI